MPRTTSLGLPASLPAELARASPAGFAYVASGAHWLPAEHLLLISDRLCAIARGDLDRLMVFMPPRSGKSQLISEYTPAWWLGTFPDKRVMLASYGAALASTWGRKARDHVAEWGPRLFGVSVDESSKASDRWDIAGREGGMVTAGVGGPLTGRGGHLILIDDPIKDAEEARSETIRAKQADWWRSVARTRLMPGGAMVLLQTRWHERDLAGLLLEDMEAGGDQWEVLSLPALADDDGDVLGREPGEALWPEFFDEDALAATKRSLGAYYWSALYQQRPAPAEGLLFKREQFRYWHPEHGRHLLVLETDRGPVPVERGACTIFQTVDVAASEKQDADFTVVQTWAATPKRDLVLLDQERQKFELADVAGLVRRCFGRERPAFVGVEAFGHGLGVVQELAREGLPIRKLTPDKDKVARALVAVARYEERRVYHPRGVPWLDGFEAELLAFPNAAHDDQVDAAAYAARELSRLPVRGRRAPDRTGTITGGLLNQQF